MAYRLVSVNFQLLSFAVFLCISSFGTAIEAQSSPEKGQKYFERGIASLKNADYTSAIALFDLALQFDSSNYQTYYNLGMAQQNMGLFDIAISNYSKALQITKERDEKSQVLSSRGTAFAANGDYERAIADYDKALELDPENPMIYSNRGLSWTAKGDNNRAILDFTKAIVLDNTYYSAYSGRGIAYFHLKDLHKALQDYSQALTINKQDVITLFNRALVYRDLQKYPEAIQDIQTALTLIEENPYLLASKPDLKAKCEVALKELKDYMGESAEEGGDYLLPQDNNTSWHNDPSPAPREYSNYSYNNRAGTSSSPAAPPRDGTPPSLLSRPPENY